MTNNRPGLSRGGARKGEKNMPRRRESGVCRHCGGKLPDNGAFVCYAPFDNPQIAIAIYGEKAGHGSDLAPIAKAMLDVYFDVDEVGDTTTYENKIG